MLQYGQAGPPATATGSAYGAAAQQQPQQQQQQAAPIGVGGFGTQNARPAAVGHLIPVAASSYGGQTTGSAGGGYSASAAAVRPAVNRPGTLAGLSAQVRRLIPCPATAAGLLSRTHDMAKTCAMRSQGVDWCLTG